jgi:hypothetical protein
MAAGTLVLFVAFVDELVQAATGRRTTEDRSARHE